MTQQPPPGQGWPPPQTGGPSWQQPGGGWSEAPSPQQWGDEARTEQWAAPGPHAAHQWPSPTSQWAQAESAGSSAAASPESATAGAAGSRVGLRAVLQLVVPILVVTALLLTEDGADTNAFEDITAWSIFAVVMALLQLAPLAGQAVGMQRATAWTVGAVGTVGLLGYWVIIVLPGVSSNAGFLLTLAAACAVIGCWLSPGRRV